MKKCNKIAALSFSVMLLSLMTGCNVSTPGEFDSSDQSSTNISEPVSDNLATNSDNLNSVSEPGAGNEITDMFELPNGDKPDLTNAVVKGFDGMEMLLSDMTADNWTTVTCEGVYLAEVLGVYYDSFVNEDLYDEENYSFSTAPDVVCHEYQRFKVGDMFGSLKVTEAQTEFNVWSADFPPRYYYGGTVRFEGSITLTGKCWLSPETEGYDTKRDIHFVPDAKSAKLIPIVLSYTDENWNDDLSISISNDACFLAEHYEFYLGNADDFENIDLSGLPEDGSCTDVRVTLEQIAFHTMKEWGRGFDCELVGLEIIQ